MTLSNYHKSNALKAILITALIIASYQLIGGGISFLFKFSLNGSLIVWVTSLSQLAFIALPVLLIVKYSEKNVALTLRFNSKFNYLIILLALPALIGIQLISSTISILILNLMPSGIKVLFEVFKTEYDKMLKMLFADKGTLFYLRNILLICLVPAFSEEILFRGYLQSKLIRQFKPGSVILLIGLLFGLAHFNPVDLPGLVLIGSFLSYLVIKSGSIYPAIIFHFLNNLIATISLSTIDFDIIGTSNQQIDTIQYLMFLFAGIMLTTLSFLLIQKFIHSPAQEIPQQ